MANRPTEQNIEEFSPYTLLRNFSKNRVLPSIILAVIAHVLVIGGFSYGFIYTTWIDPSSKSDDTGTAEGSGETSDDAGDEDSSDKSPGDVASSETAAKTDGDATETSDGDELNSPVVREITEKANPDEIPDNPDDFGISIDDTNP